VQGQRQHLVINNQRKDTKIRIWPTALDGLLMFLSTMIILSCGWRHKRIDKSLSWEISYHPGFYVLPRNESDGLHLFQILSRRRDSS